jgi:hypothetical protein
MKKLSFLTIAICIIGILAIAPAATADLTRLNSVELSRVTGQSGFSFLGSFLGHDIEDGMISYTKNTEGVPGVRANMTGTILDNDFEIDSDVDSRSPAVFGLVGSRKVSNVTLNNPTVTMNNFQTNVGSVMGISGGNSMGVAGFRSMQIKTTGSVRVSMN